MSLLTIAQSVSMRVMKQRISTAATNADVKTAQMVEFINEDGQELAARHSWQALINESTFNTVATESQGLITALAGADFSFIVNQTLWNRSRRRPLFGPISSAQWQAFKAQFSQSPWGQYRLRGNAILITPVPTAGDAIYFEWCSKNWCSAGTSMTADTDTSKLDERIHVLGGIWRWKRAQQLDYSEDKDKYEKAIDDSITRDGSKGVLDMSGGGKDFFPGYLVQAGNFTL